MLGSPEDEEDRNDDEGPQIQVTANPMWVAKFEVRWDAYREFMDLYYAFTDFEADGVRVVNDDNRIDAITAPTPLYKSSHTYEFGEEDEQSAVSMTQYAAQQFTKWLSALTGRQYRLPTEAEWEYACRGGTKTTFVWGDDTDDAEDHAWYFDNAEDGQSEGGQKEPNAFGLFDMIWNVGEWTVNAHTEDGYASWEKTQPINAIEIVQWPETGTNCVVRGGTWQSYTEELRSAARMRSDDDVWKELDPNLPVSPWWFTSDPSRGVGFRLFRSYQPESEKTIRKFWDHVAPDAMDDVQTRLTNQKGKIGLVDKDLPKAIEAL